MPQYTDPAPSRERQRFECPECGRRATSAHGPVVCECGTEMRNISVTRSE
ncbi:MAG: rubrerythrin-like domain-containing protein [Halapricum sp.]